MATPEQIRQALKDMAKDHGPAVSNIAKVKSVDESTALCVLIDEDEQEILNVRLRPVLSDKKSFILVPKVGSYVLAVRVEDDDDWMIIAADEVTKVGYYIENTIIEIDAAGFLFQKENETLKKIMVDLITAIKAMSFLVTTPDTLTGSTTTLNNVPQFTAIETRINQFLK
jgi:predicted  nucleic acid-binding Zn-ribbon protein